ncbi:hypothetical protein V5P93_000967 [Actinokineospora auranticolor]|uniref:hypothetical protein n=1 Tax=Actinokineospora auranticolor TaxID=155976 RepID=UPI000CECAF81|nr:hypothetical protein [Actinokineospora auranticolor]
MKFRAVTSALAIAALSGSLALVAEAPASADVHVLSCRYVLAQSLTLWNAPSGGANVGAYHAGDTFQESGIEGSYRFRINLGTGATVWVTADPAYSRPC